jgi:hypothetical protein
VSGFSGSLRGSIPPAYKWNLAAKTTIDLDEFLKLPPETAQGAVEKVKGENGLFQN